MSVPATILAHIRSLLEDSDTDGQYFTDEELVGWLEQERGTIQPWAPGQPRGVVSGGSWPSGGWPTSAGRMPSAGSTLAPGPGFTRYQAQPALRFWAEDPAPVVYVDGAIADSGDYEIDTVTGSVTFDAAQGENAIVCAAFDYFNVYEAAYVAASVAMRQWASVAEVQTPAMKMKRASLADALSQIERLRRKGKVQRTPRRPAPMY